MLFAWRSALVDREPWRGGCGSPLTVEITQPLRTTKRWGGSGALPSSRWRPVLGRRLLGFVTFGLWWLVSIMLAIGGGEGRELVAVDERGLLTVQRV